MYEEADKVKCQGKRELTRLKFKRSGCRVYGLGILELQLRNS